jgi:hypothetical protein
MSLIKTSKKNANKDKKKFNVNNADLASGHVDMMRMKNPKFTYKKAKI